MTGETTMQPLENDTTPLLTEREIQRKKLEDLNLIKPKDYSKLSCQTTDPTIDYTNLITDENIQEIEKQIKIKKAYIFLHK